ncbi:ArsR/SmtB family transcription factor [Actinomadura kijaniata]|uniref:ArsR/SmtB family transcription factor n=1 Tax=Actinomadura kijaniata TaxID=46161 RepID=UPI00082CA935|nr:helix-turn-helix transcriptional regulator [Actinomadura kijaniata]
MTAAPDPYAPTSHTTLNRVADWFAFILDNLEQINRVILYRLCPAEEPAEVCNAIMELHDRIDLATGDAQAVIELCRKLGHQVVPMWEPLPPLPTSQAAASTTAPATTPTRPAAAPAPTRLPAAVAKIPADARERILTFLAQRGPEGAQPRELTKLGGKSRATVSNWLTALREHGFITVAGATSAARYYLPEHAPGDHDP